MTTLDPQPGQWVLIRAKVLRRVPCGDVSVELFSKTSQHDVDVLPDHVVEIVPAPRKPHELEIVESRALSGNATQVKFRCPDCYFTGQFVTSPPASAAPMFEVMSAGHQETA